MMQGVYRWRSAGGFTLMEAIIVMGIVIVGAAITIPVTLQMVASAKGDSALVITATFLEQARSRAVAERRNVELSFTSDNEMEMIRIEVPSGDRTVIGQMRLEGEEEFIQIAGLPDTPDRFGANDPITFTGTTPVMFTSDGSLIDAAGDVTNGTIFIARPGSRDTARAVSIAGVTGMVRRWKWNGSAWQQ